MLLWLLLRFIYQCLCIKACVLFSSPVVARTSCEGSEDPGRGGHVSDREESPGVNVP